MRSMGRLKCYRKNIKRELNGKGAISIILIILLALIILPTGIDDIFTTIPLFMFLGLKKYLILSGITIILLWINKNKIKKMFKRIKKC